MFHEDQLGKLDAYNKSVSPPHNIKVLSVHPGINASNIAVGTNINVVFDDNINMSTVNPSTFIVNDGGTAGIYSYNSQTKTITFTPEEELNYNSFYSILLTTGIKNPVGENLSGNFYWTFTTVAEAQPDIYITTPVNSINSGDTWNFGSVLENEMKETEFTIENIGSGNLTISEVKITGAASDQFDISVIPPLEIVPNSSAVLTVEFSPSSPGIKNSVLTISNDDTNDPEFIINLTGTGLETDAPEMQIAFNGIIVISDLTNVSFGTIPLGTTMHMTLIMSNIGSSNLVISDVYIDGNNPGLFSTDFNPKTVTPGASEEFTITFAPGFSTGMKLANIIFKYNNDQSPFIIKVRGRGY